ncbi:MAG: polyphosphate kinase 2 family protein [Planctomycetes bacterium]|nr:polyphosphate kinase 2 family protein [Planctomycetota bacterium]MCB9886388.1 polyphosphate kinase 2 family protein [Planctomycetota bacterium]
MSRFDQHRIVPGAKLRLADHDPHGTPAFDGDKQEGKQRLAALNERLEELQEALYAEGKQRLLVVLQALDAGGKDGTIRAVFDGVNPQGVKVKCFKRPTELELAHDFLWRVHPHVPGNGEIAIWNRSHYEDVLVVRVHDLVPKAQWRRRYEHIAAFERLLADEGTVIRKFFLHISKDEQRERLQERIDNPKKRWKWNDGDLQERARWNDYQEAYEEAIVATSTEAAPWYVVPADRNWYRDLVISEVLVHTLEGMHIRLPEGDPDIAGTVVK